MSLSALPNFHTALSSSLIKPAITLLTAFLSFALLLREPAPLLQIVDTNVFSFKPNGAVVAAAAVEFFYSSPIFCPSSSWPGGFVLLTSPLCLSVLASRFCVLGSSLLPSPFDGWVVANMVAWVDMEDRLRFDIRGGGGCVQCVVAGRVESLDDAAVALTVSCTLSFAVAVTCCCRCWLPCRRQRANVAFESCGEMARFHKASTQR